MYSHSEPLTGDQIKQIRMRLNESQAAFASRIQVSQPAIHRMEVKGAECQDGPAVILIRQIAEKHGIAIDPAGAVA